MHGVFRATLSAAAVLVAGSIGSAQEPPKPRWEPAYKIKPHQTERLTAADVVGPDGVVYPDWRYAGIPGGIPDVPEVARVERFGAAPDDGDDDGDALARAARHVGRQGGGAVVLDRGTWSIIATSAARRPASGWAE